jgi:hypothetical protein
MGSVWDWGTRLSEYPDRTICTDLGISIAGSPAGEMGARFSTNALAAGQKVDIHLIVRTTARKRS